jgi:hypothetical protein
MCMNCSCLCQTCRPRSLGRRHHLYWSYIVCICMYLFVSVCIACIICICMYCLYCYVSVCIRACPLIKTDLGRRSRRSRRRRRRSGPAQIILVESGRGIQVITLILGLRQFLISIDIHVHNMKSGRTTGRARSPA